ncbi:MAG: hypothetical protein QG566_743 [Patescibacteria group bacterium]|jgi:hypothetical protein|nr:hypothetical protein [Patescibacteria group bacterium]
MKKLILILIVVIALIFFFVPIFDSFEACDFRTIEYRNGDNCNTSKETGFQYFFQEAPTMYQ